MQIRKVLGTCLAVSALWAADAPPKFAERHPRYKLQPSDVVEVHYRFTPEYNSTVTIQPDGYVTLDMAGNIHIAGETLEEAAAEISKSAGARLREPEVSLVLKEFVKPHFVVAGEVARPGTYDLRGDITTVQAIAMSGGFKESAKHSQVMLVRRVDNQWAEVKVLDLKKMMSTGQVMEDLTVRPDDIILVPQSRVSRMERYVRWAGLGMYGLTLTR